jgi:GNAT superfamily N-acetyltransferase
LSRVGDLYGGFQHNTRWAAISQFLLLKGFSHALGGSSALHVDRRNSMDTIIKEVTPATMLSASFEHFVAYEMHCAQAPHGESHDTPELAWAISGVLSAYMNSVVRTRLSSETDNDAVIETVLAHAKRRSVPMGWFLLPGTTPGDMGSKLEAHGLKHDGDDPGMSVDLQALPDRVPAPDNLRIVEVLDLSTLDTWVNTWGDSYEANEAKRHSRFVFRASQGLNSKLPYRSYLAYLDDQPVATSELFLGAGVAAIVWVGTVPSARRQGIGAAITLAPLLEARRLGYRIGSLMASPLGYLVYRQLGFQEYCRFPVYVWQPADH